MYSQNARSDDSRGTDPRTLRAVAHPVRLDLLSLLETNGPLTASRCGEFLKLTPKLCSYHLTLLGRYGLIEETGGGKGRARPWRLVTRDLTYVHRGNEPDADANAADQFARTLLARDARMIEAFIDRRRRLAPAWRNVAAMTSRPLRLTADQLAALRTEMLELLDRYARMSQVDTAGSQPVHVALYAVPVDIGDPAR